MTKKRHGWWRRLGASIAAVGVFAASGVVVAQAQDDSGVDAGTVGSETVDTPPSSEASTGGLDVPGGVESAPDDGNAEAEEGDIDAADFAGMNDVPDVSRMRSLPDTFGRAAQQAYSTKQLTLVPEANPLAYVDQQGASGGIAPRLRVGTTIGGQRDQTTIRLTELVIRYYPSSPQYDLGGPVEVVKNGNEFCRVGTENIKAVGYARNGKVNQISVDLSSCKPQIGVWEGHNDRVEVYFHGTGTNPARVNQNYTFELYGQVPLPPPVEPEKDPVVKTWVNDKPTWGSVTTTVTSGEKDKSHGRPARVKMEATVTKPMALPAAITARIQDQNGWDFDGDSTPTMTIYNPDGSVLHKAVPTPAKNFPALGTNTNMWGGSRFAMPADFTVPEGAKIVVEMEFHSRSDTEVTNSSFEGPLGPGDLSMFDYPEKTEWLTAPVANPELPKRCGLRIAIVGDQSRSLVYGDKDGWEASRDAAKALVAGLSGTPTKVGIYSFASQAPASGKEGVGTTWTKAPGVDSARDVNNQEELKDITSAIDGWNTRDLASGEGATNWAHGLKQLQGQNYDVVYFITDGMPTLSFPNDARQGFGAFMDEQALNAAIDEANKLKKLVRGSFRSLSDSVLEPVIS